MGKDIHNEAACWNHGDQFLSTRRLSTTCGSPVKGAAVLCYYAGRSAVIPAADANNAEVIPASAGVRPAFDYNPRPAESKWAHTPTQRVGSGRPGYGPVAEMADASHSQVPTWTLSRPYELWRMGEPGFIACRFESYRVHILSYVVTGGCDVKPRAYDIIAQKRRFVSHLPFQPPSRSPSRRGPFFSLRAGFSWSRRQHGATLKT